MRSATRIICCCGCIFHRFCVAGSACPSVWRTLLRNRASFSDVFFTIGEGYLLNNFLPFRLGEVGRAFLLSRKSDMQFMEILPTIVIERAMDLGYSAIILLAALPFVVGAEGTEQIGIYRRAIVLAGFVMLYLLARYNSGRWICSTS
jgi:uncharacterized membrane protein YbhN (UPF0104 family)